MQTLTKCEVFFVRGSSTVVYLSNAIKRQTTELGAARIPFSARDGSRAFHTYLKRLLNAD